MPDRTKPLPELTTLVRSSGIHLRAISKEIPEPSITKISLEIAYLIFHSNFPGANELMPENIDDMLTLMDVMA